jgi:manganese-dependent inorganic pyrophosphatase
MRIYCIGHKNPDLDSITASISVAYLFNKINEYKREMMMDDDNNIYIPILSKNAKIDRLSREIIKKSFMNLPERREIMETDNVFLVDHSERRQLEDGINDKNIMGLIDHHMGGDIEVKSEGKIVWRVGATNTIIYKLYRKNGIYIPDNISKLMIYSILMDTKMGRSNYVEDDREAIEDLTRQTKMELEEYRKRLGEIIGKLRYEREDYVNNMRMVRYRGEKIGIGSIEILKVGELEKELEWEDMGKYIIIMNGIMDGKSVICVSDREKMGELMERYLRGMRYERRGREYMVEMNISRKRLIEYLDGLEERDGLEGRDVEV